MPARAIHHVDLAVSDVERSLRSIWRCSAPLGCLDIGAQIHFPPEDGRDIDGCHELFVFDPDGLRIEVA